MRNWKKLIIGDAFRIPSRGPDYWRDMILAWPFTLFSVVSTAYAFNGSRGSADRRYFQYALLISFLSLALAKERLFLVCAALAFVGGRGLIALLFQFDWKILMISVCCLAGVGIIGVLRGGLTFSYALPRNNDWTIFDLLVGLGSLVGTLLLANYLRP